MIKTYRELRVWQHAMKLVTCVYDLSKRFPRDELYGLTSQVRRAAVSIPSNIAEGFARDSLKEYLYHLSVAFGSIAEVETQINLAKILEYIDQEEEKNFLVQADELGKMLRSMQIALRQKLGGNKVPEPSTQNLEPAD